MGQEQAPTIPHWTTRQVVLATLVVLMVVGAFWILFRFSWVVFVLFVAAVLGTAFRPAVDWLSQRGLKRIRAVILIYLVLFLLLVSFVAISAPLVVEQASEISKTLTRYYGLIRNSLAQSPSMIVRQIAVRFPVDFSLLTTPSLPEGDVVARVSSFLATASSFTRGILFLIAVFLLGFYWTLEGERILRGFTFWLPLSKREEVRELIDQIEERVGGFIIGQSILCLIIGVMAFVAYTLIGLPNVLALAIIAGLLEAVPVVGPALGAVPAFIIALTTDPTKAVWVIVSTLVIQTLENNLLVPRVMKRSVGISPIITLLALATFTSLLGLPGALLAVPMGAIIQLLLDRYLLAPGAIETQVPVGRDQLSLIRYEAQQLTEDIRKQLRVRPDQTDDEVDRYEDEIEAIVGDLDSLLLDMSGEGSSL
jgi:predicted PurR-regulated permease PerM